MDDTWPGERAGVAAAGPFSTRSPFNVTTAGPAATSQGPRTSSAWTTRRVAEGTHRHGGCWTFFHTITIQCDRSSPRPQQAPRPPAKDVERHGRRVAEGTHGHGGCWTFFHTITIQCDRSSPCNHQPGRRAAWTVRDRARARAGVVAARPPSHAHRSPFNVAIGGTAYRRAHTPHTQKNKSAHRFFYTTPTFVFFF